MRAYVLLKVKPQDTMRLMHDLKDNDNVLGASVIHGPYDCVALVQGLDLDELNKTVLDIRAQVGVIDTMTSLVVQSWERAPA